MKIIAEVSNTHEGDIAYLYNHVDKLSKIQIKNIKFQYLVPSEFGCKGSENYTEFDRLKIPEVIFSDIINLHPDINFYFDVFGEESLNNVLRLMDKHENILGIKLHATSSMNFDLIDKVSNRTNNVFISLSGLTAIEINNLISFCVKQNLQDKLVLTYGVQNYPTDVSDIKIRKLIKLKQIYGLRICLSEHLDGELKLAKDIVSLANILGYDFIEKHSTLDRDRRKDDDHSALNISEMKVVIDEQVMINKLKNQNLLSLSDNELAYRNKVKSGLFTRKELKKGDTLTAKDLYMKRLEGGSNSFLNMNDILGKNLMHSLNKDKPLNLGMLHLDIVGVVLVRSGSSRLKEKALKSIGDTTSIDFLIKRLKKSKIITQLVLCTTDNAEDNVLEKIAIDNQIKCVRGDENIFERLDLLFSSCKCDIFIRLTGDNVFVDPKHVDSILKEFTINSYDYYKHEKVIDGCDFEVINKSSYDTLDVYFKNYRENSEYMTLFLKNNYFRIMNPKRYDFGIDFSKYRFTLDYLEDLENINNAYLSLNNPHFTYEELCNSIKNNEFNYKEFYPLDKSIYIKPEKR